LKGYSVTKYIIILTALLISGIACKKSPTAPTEKSPTSCTYPAGNRNFTWRMDTVAWFPSTVGGVWAFSDSDAYLMGYIGEGKPPYNIFMGLHWNGVSWDTSIHGTPMDIKHYSNDVTGDDHFMVSVGYWDIANEKAGLAEFDNNTKTWKGYQFQNSGALYSVWTDGKGFFTAVGPNGMIYTKDGYSAGWIYSKAPTDFAFINVTGVSKNEIYFLGIYYNIGGKAYRQIWRYTNNNWLKLLDNLDTTNTPIKITNNENVIDDLYIYRCSITDSVRVFVIGWESYLFEAKGNSTDYKSINLTTLGLPLRNMGRTGERINAFTPNDVWIFGSRFNFFHWNGSNYQWMIIPGLPNDDLQFGDNRKMVKTSSGKIFFPTEVSSQVYVVEQGTP
jgi:hypothetical protein